VATDQAPHYRLNGEQRAQVRDCLRKAGLPLTRDRLEQFISGIEISIAHFRAIPPEATFRDAHDALRDLWELSRNGDPSIGQLRARLKTFPIGRSNSSADEHGP
jgi:hypothetical protein